MVGRRARPVRQPARGGQRPGCESLLATCQATGSSSHALCRSQAALSNRSQSIGCGQLRSFLTARQRGQKDGDLREQLTDTDVESAHLLRALRRQSQRNLASKEQVNRQRARDLARSGAGHSPKKERSPKKKRSPKKGREKRA